MDRLPLMPITMMFACAQIGARYRDYCTDYRVLVEGQIRTAEAFGFDYVNTMSDPAREAADCGAVVEYFDHQPVAIVEDQALLADKTKLASLKIPDPLGGGRMHNGLKALALFTRSASAKTRSIEGWIEGPIAEGADLRGINTLMLDFFDDPAFVRDLFAFVIEMELRFAREQLKAGADIIGVGDAAASLVGPEIYDEFVWPYEKQLVDGIHALGGKVRLHICGNTRRILEGMGKLGCDIVDLDSLAPISEARQKMGPRCDPAWQPQPGDGAAQRRPGGSHRGHRRMPPPGRRAFHRRRRLRSAARHAARESARLMRLRPHPQALAWARSTARSANSTVFSTVAPTYLTSGPFGFRISAFGFRISHAERPVT